METEFISYINKVDDSFNLDIDQLKDLNNNIDNFIDYIKSINRPELKRLKEIDKIFQNLRLLVEASKIHNANAEYYIDKNYYKYILNKYTSASFRIQGFATETTKKHLKELIKITKNDKDVYPFNPLFLNLMGLYYHIYQNDGLNAMAYYKEAIKILEKTNAYQFHTVTTFNYKKILDIIKNNLLDALIRTHDPKKYYTEIYSLKNELIGSENEVSIESKTELIELYIRLGDRKKAESILNSLKNEKYKDLEYYYPQLYMVKAIMSFDSKNISEAFDNVIQSFNYSFKKGNPLSYKIYLIKLFSIINRYLSDISKNERFNILKDKGFLDLILQIIGKKDKFLTASHSKNVADLSLRLWKIMNGEESSNEDIYLSGFFHDVGKLTIPWFTLGKPSKLDEIDKDIIHHHTLEGYKLMMLLNFEKEAEAARNHHERIDGSGYLRGMKKIPNITQIVAMADIYLAATDTNRQYKIPKSKEKLIFELEKDVRNGRFEKTLVNSLEYIITDN